MKLTDKDLERQMQALSYDAVKKAAGDLTLDAETKQRILDKTLRRTGVKPAMLVKSAASSASVRRERKFLDENIRAAFSFSAGEQLPEYDF